MKRDARIGLAVVLVLGLGVTLLIGRALYHNHGATADADGDNFALNDGDTRTGGKSDTGSPANANSVGSDTTTVPPNSGGVPPGAAEFIAGQTNTIQQTGGRGTSTQVGGGSEVPQNPQPPVNPPAPHRGETAPAGNDYYAYTAVSGDSPWSIASKVFGDGKYTQKIVEANDLTNKKIKPGMVLRIPAIANKPMVMKLQPFNDPSAGHVAHEGTSVKPSLANTTAADHGIPITTKGSYKVETGDTLSTIAKKHYGSNGPKTIQLIVAANHGLDPAKLRVGQEIALPVVK